MFARMELRAGWVLAAGLLLTAACAQAAPRGADPLANPSAVETPAYGGLLHLPARVTFDGKDPHKGTGGSQLGLKARPAYEPLVAYKAEPGTNFRVVREVVPWLAEKWEQPNPAEYVFTLRQGVKFHDGMEMTSQDVVYSLKRAADLKTQFVNGGVLRTLMKDVEALDRYRVRLTLNGVTPDFLYDGLADFGRILPKHLEEQGQSFDKVAVGTGPYKLITLDNQKGITFEKNSDYWDKGRPYLDGVVVHQGLDDAATVAALSTGRIDAYNPGLLPDLQQVHAVVDGFQTAEYTEVYANAVLMRLDKPPFSDIRVRRAFHLALDRQRLLETGLFGKGMLAAPSAQPDNRWAIPPAQLAQLPGYRQPKTQDLAEAKRLMVEAGYPNGFKLEMKFRPSLSSSNSIAQPIATAWRDLGVEITLRPQETGVFEQDRIRGNYDAILTTTSAEDPFKGFQEYYSSKGIYATYGINDPELDKLIIDALGEPDQAKRLQMGYQIQRTILDKVYGIPTVERITFAGWQRWVKNYLYNPGAQVIPLYAPAITWLDPAQLPDHRKGEKLPF